MAMHRWLDHKRKTMITTDSAVCPEGCSPFEGGPVPPGYGVQISMSVMDAARQAVALLDAAPARCDTALYPKAGRSRIMADAGALDDALAACPASLRGLQFKVAQTMLQAGGGSGMRDNAIDNLRSFAAQYASAGFLLQGQSQTAKEACARAAQVLTGFVDGMVMARDGGPQARAVSREQAHAAMRDRLANGWRA